VNVNTRAQFSREVRFSDALNDFVDREIGLARMLAMEQDNGNPDFVSHLQSRFGFGRHGRLPKEGTVQASDVIP
jgi:hypothetical protein